MNINDKLITLNNLDTDKILIDINDYQRNNIYYDNNYQRLLIKTPKLKVLFMPMIKSESKNISILVSLGPLIKNSSDTKINELKDFYNLINKIDNYVKKNINTKFKPSINKTNKNFPTMYFNMPFVKENNKLILSFNLYNHRNKKINISSINNTSIISFIIELSHLWTNSDNEKGLQWNIMQMKLYPDLTFSKCVFSDCEEDINDKDETECFHCLHCPNLNIPLQQNIPVNILPPPPPKLDIKTEKKYIPSISDLITMRNKLKKIND